MPQRHGTIRRGAPESAARRGAGWSGFQAHQPAGEVASARITTFIAMTTLRFRMQVQSSITRADWTFESGMVNQHRAVLDEHVSRLFVTALWTSCELSISTWRHKKRIRTVIDAEPHRPFSSGSISMATISGRRN